MKQRSSPIWSFVRQTSHCTAECMVCGMVLSFNRRTTTNLNRHLRIKHRDKFRCAVALAQRKANSDLESGCSVEDDGSSEMATTEDKVQRRGPNPKRTDVICSICEKRFPSNKELIGHIDAQHPDVCSKVDETVEIKAAKSNKRGQKSWPWASPAWVHMTKICPTVVMCQLCKRMFVYTERSTTSLVRHLKLKHPEKYAEAKEIQRAKIIHELDSGRSSTLESGADMATKTTGAEDATPVDHGLSSLDEESDHDEESEPKSMERPLEVKSLVEKPSTRRDTPEMGRPKKALRTDESSVWHGKMMFSEAEKRTRCEAKTTTLAFAREYQLDRLLENVIVTGIHPCSLVENAIFKKFVHALNPKYTLPDTNRVKHSLLKQYGDKKTLLQERLDKIPALSVSTEVWRYREREQYLSLTAHFVGDTWELESVLLATVWLSHTHLAQSIHVAMGQVFDDYNIKDKVKCVISDGTQEVVEAVAGLNIPQVQCVAHALNQLVKRSLESSDDICRLIERVRSIVVFFHHCIQASKLLKEFQGEEGKESLKLTQDRATNWLTTLEMFRSYLELHDMASRVLHCLERGSMILTVEETDCLRRCIQLLEPFKLAAQDCASDRYPLLSKYIPLMEILQQRTSNFIQGKLAVSLTEYDSVTELAEVLGQQVGQCGADGACFHSGAATLVDPRFKHIILKKPDVRSKLEEKLLQEVERPHTDGLAVVKDEAGESKQLDESTGVLGDTQQVAVVVTVVPEASFWDVFDETVEEAVSSQTPRSLAVSELHHYCEEKPIKREENPFVWWRERDSVYPNLGKVAKQLLCIPATSVPSSQIFSLSESEKLKVDRRSLLDESHLDMILFLGESSYTLQRTDNSQA